MSRVIGHIYDILNNNVKRSSFIWKKTLKSIFNNLNSFNPEQSSGILLALYKCNLHQSEDGSKIANSLINNVEKCIKLPGFNYIASIKLIQLYYEIESINRIEFDISRIENILLYLLKDIKNKSIQDIINLLPLLAISSSYNSYMDIHIFNHVFQTILNHSRNISTQSFLPTDKHIINTYLDQISLLLFIISNYNYNLDFTSLLLLIGESTGNLPSLLRLHYSLSKLSNKSNISSHLKHVLSQLEDQSTWSNKSHIFDSSKLICTLKMFDSPFIIKIYQTICNSIESFDKMDRSDINLYLKTTIDLMDKSNPQYQFLNKIESIGLITKPHRANLKWNTPIINYK